MRAQKTIGKPVRFAGVGIHTGSEVEMGFHPADVGEGIVFQRIDLPGKPIVPATLETVVDTSRSTTLGRDNVFVHTVEHVLAACKAFHIDNLRITLSAHEPPIGNGSSDVFVSMLDKAGVVQQEMVAESLVVQEPIYYTDGEIHIVAIPHPTWKISYTLHYPSSSALQAQYYSNEITQDHFRHEIAPCRTFSMYDEVALLMDRGLIKGGSLDNAVVVKGDAVFSKEGLRFPNEMARHKTLDMIGDLSLLPFDICAHIIAIRSGHRTNYAFAKILEEHRIATGVYV